MRWIRPQHTRWLAACLLTMLLSVWAGGLSFSVVVVFMTIFATGAALLASGFPAPPVPDWTSAEENDADSPAEDGDADADSPAEGAEDPQPVSE
jgi:hypothetical protein